MGKVYVDNLRLKKSKKIDDLKNMSAADLANLDHSLLFLRGSDEFILVKDFLVNADFAAAELV